MYYEVLRHSDGLPFNWFSTFPINSIYQVFLVFLQSLKENSQYKKDIEVICQILLFYHSVLQDHDSFYKLFKNCQLLFNAQDEKCMEDLKFFTYFINVKELRFKFERQ